MLEEKNLHDEEIRDRDKIQKVKGKEYINRDRSARQSDIRVENVILWRKDKINKLIKIFKPDLYEVNKKMDNEVELKSLDGKLSEELFLNIFIKKYLKFYIKIKRN